MEQDAQYSVRLHNNRRRKYEYMCRQLKELKAHYQRLGKGLPASIIIQQISIHELEDLLKFALKEDT